MSDSANGYQGKIAIELRGSMSRQFPKKNYRLETQDAQGENLNVSLLGMPADNDWVLYGGYNDETLLRNAFAYQLSNAFGRYAVRTVYCELVLDGDYRGIYLLMEKIKRDKNRVDIKAMDADDVAGDSLTGGYIIKIDKGSGESIGGWRSAKRIQYQYDYPKPADIQPQQKAYIQQYMNDFEELMSADLVADQRHLNNIDLDSFVDHFILNELCKNVDAYRISAFLYKNADSRDSKLYAGPIWDFDLTMSKAFFPQDAGIFEGWQLDYRLTHPTDGYQVPFWWENLGHSPAFAKRAQQRWIELRQDRLRLENLYALIDQLRGQISEALDRNFQKWPGVLKNGATYDSHIEIMKQWLANRLQWIDANLPQLATGVESSFSHPAEFVLMQNYPNPFNSATVIEYYLSSPCYVELKIFDLLGHEVECVVGERQSSGRHRVEWTGIHLSSGIYFYRLYAGPLTETRKLILQK